MLLVERSNTGVPLAVTIDREGTGGVTGLVPTVALRNARTVNSYLDFGDGTFKTSGWATKYATMTEIERGHYQRLVDFSSIPAIVSGFVASAEFHVDNGVGILGDDHDLIFVVESVEDVPADVLALLSSSVPIAQPTGMVLAVPILERPQSGSIAYKLVVAFAYNGTLADPDANTINVSASNQGGVSRDANLSALTMTRISIGRYEVLYTVASIHLIEEVVFVFTATKGGNSFMSPFAAAVLDTTAAPDEIVASGS